MCDRQICEANKIFTSKLTQLKSRCRDSENQTNSLIASADAASQTAKSSIKQRDEANLALAKSKLEVLMLKKMLAEMSPDLSTTARDRSNDLGAALSLEDEMISLASMDSFSPPIPARSKPSNPRPATSSKPRAAPTTVSIADQRTDRVGTPIFMTTSHAYPDRNWIHTRHAHACTN